MAFRAQKLLDGITKKDGLASMHLAQAYAQDVGFGYKKVEEVIEAVRQEHAELLLSHASGDVKLTREEIGDNLFILLRLCQWYQIDPNDLLRENAKKFLRRMITMETHLAKNGQTWQDVTDWRVMWREAKRGYTSNSPAE